LPGIERKHHASFGIDLENHEIESTAGAGSGHAGLRGGFAFGDLDAKCARQNAFHRSGFNHGDEFQIAFHAGEIECQEVVSRFDPAPTPKLVGGNHAVGHHVDLLDGEGFVVIDEPVERPFARLPQTIKAQNGSEADGERDAREPCPSGPEAARSEFHVEHILSAGCSPVSCFMFEPHFFVCRRRLAAGSVQGAVNPHRRPVADRAFAGSPGR
jgi:hypothetical protein